METLKKKLAHTLRQSGRYMKTDMVYLAKGGSWLGAGQIVSSLTAFFLSVAFANLFPKEAYGEYKYIFSIIGVAGAFSLTGMDAALSQAVARGFDGTLMKGARLTFIWSLGTTTVLAAIAGYYFLNHNPTLGWGLVIAAVATPFLKSFNLYGSFLVGKKDFSRRTRYGMLYDVLPGLAVIGALWLYENPIILVATYFTTYTLVAGGFYALTKRRYRPAEPADEGVKRYSLNLSVMNFLGTVSFQLDKILTFHYLGAAQLATYSIATGIPQHLRQAQKIVGALALPRFSERTMESIRTNIHRKALFLFAVMMTIAGAYIITAPFIFRILFSQYMESVLYSQIFALVLLFAPGALYQQALTAQRHTRALYVLQIVGTPIRFLFLFMLIPIFGIWGIIVSLFVNETIRLILAAYFVHHPMPITNRLPDSDAVEQETSEISV